MTKTKAVQNPRKRSAFSQDGPLPKKAKINQRHGGSPKKQDSKPQGKTKNTDGDLKRKKRALPVTRVQEEENALDSGDSSEDDLDNVAMEDNMEAQDSEELGPSKKSSASHAAQRALPASRRAVKPHASLLIEAKRIWAQARQKNREGTEGNRNGVTETRAYVSKLMDLVRGHVQDLVLKHDASRIIQTIVKYGTPAQRLEVAKELQGQYLQLVQGKYSKFLVVKLIRYCPAARPFILPEFAPHVPRLLHHAFASSVLADAYEVFCTAAERQQLLRAFWGREAALFGDGLSGKPPKKTTDAPASVVDARDEEVDRTAAQVPSEGGLKAVLTASGDAERRKRTLVAVRENLLEIFNHHSPVATRHAIVHRVLWEYLEAVGCADLFDSTMFPDQERERAWREVYESCQELLPEMVHTREGSRSVREFLTRGTAKDRKQIVKVLKPHLPRIAQDDEAQTVLFTALDVIDDTKLVAKQLIGELLPHPPTPTLPADLLKTTSGRRALLCLIVPRSTRHFPPALIATLAATDDLRAETSKKDNKVRADEIRQAASPALLALVAEHGVALSRDPKGSLVVAEILLFAEGEKSAAQETLLGPLASPYPSPDGTEPHPIDLPHTSRLYKTLLQGGHYDRTTGNLARAEAFDAGTFAHAFVRTAGSSGVLGMARGNGAFVIAELCARLCAEGDPAVKDDVRAWFSGDVREEIRRGSAKGRDVLLEKLRELDAVVA